MKNSQFPNNEFGNALKNMVSRNEEIYREYIISDYKGYRYATKIPEEVAHFWLRNSVAFKLGLLNWYMIGQAAEDSEKPIHWMNKGAIRVDDGEDPYHETWLYKHDFSYWVVVPKGR